MLVGMKMMNGVDDFCLGSLTCRSIYTSHFTAYMHTRRRAPRVDPIPLISCIGKLPIPPITAGQLVSWLRYKDSLIKLISPINWYSCEDGSLVKIFDRIILPRRLLVTERVASYSLSHKNKQMDPSFL
jgi:hypothetical protein